MDRPKTLPPMLCFNYKYSFVTAMAVTTCTDNVLNQTTIWWLFTMANFTSGIFLLMLPKCLKTDGEESSPTVERSMNSQKASVTYRSPIQRMNHKAPAFVWLQVDTCKAVLFIRWGLIWEAIMIKVSKSPEMQTDVISVLSIVKVKVVPFQVCTTL